MKLNEIYAREMPVISFEIFPPKPQTPIETVFTTLEQLTELTPAFISVTYGAGGSSAARSIEIASRVKNAYGVETVAHLTCANASRTEIDQILRELRDHHIENILALRGDPPAGEGYFSPVAEGYRYAKELIAHIKETGQFSVAAAAYPEGHLECRNLELDIYYLKEKTNQGVDLLITQLFFDNDFFYRFRERAEAKGVHCPIAAGIMPVLNVQQIKRITSLCGASIPEKLAKLMDRYGGVPSDMVKAGMEYACEQIVDLLENKVAGIHLYTMNKAEQTKQIIRQVGLVK
ncbi:MAG: methylenetetrahydrofolate reductase [NAD(P)H] [Negativicutes bacterium]|nr:methylenetetrahydrofolate reductase [NAD(P)H] [Negativicutes bacterium]